MMSLRLLCCALVLALGLGLSSSVEVEAQPTRSVTKTVDVAPDGTVALRVIAGHVRVTTWDRSAMRMDVQIQGESAAQIDSAQVQVEKKPRRVAVEMEGPDADGGGLLALLGFGGSAALEARYRLRIPAAAELSVTTDRAPVEVRGLEGDLSVEGSSAPVRLRSVTGDVQVATFSGGLDADSVRGEVAFATFSGDARVRAPRLARRHQIASFSGDAEVTLPADAAFDLCTDITWGGSVTSDFARPDSLARSDGTVPIGGGGPTVAFESFSGGLTLQAE